MGNTYLATHQGVNQSVVLKSYHPAVPQADQQVQAFITYAQSLSRFHYPHLSRVIGAFQEDGVGYMVSEYIEGVSLGSLVNRQPLPESVAIAYIRQVGLGLKTLHRHGLLHLNVRPSRILQRSYDQSLVLLGLNSRQRIHARQPAPPQPYLAPEHYQAQPKVSLPGEVYALAATLYTLVTGQEPVNANARGVSPLPAPRQIRPDLSPGLEQAILQGMALSPQDRPTFIAQWLSLLPDPALVSSVATPSPSPQSTPTQLQTVPTWQVKLPSFAGTKAATTTVVAEPPLQSDPFLCSTTCDPPIDSQPDLSPTNLSGEQGQFSPAKVHPKASPTEAIFDGQSKPISPEAHSGPAPTPGETAITWVAPELPLQVAEEAPPLMAPAQETSPEQSSPEQSQSEGTPAAPFASTHLESTHLESTHPDDPPASPPTPSAQPMTARSLKTKHRFPAWPLFWCALLAACGGLGVGLWFRWQLTRQFAMPLQPQSAESGNPLPQQEQFLPTSTSIIPEPERESRPGEDSSERGLTESPWSNTDLPATPIEAYPRSTQFDPAPPAPEAVQTDPLPSETWPEERSAQSPELDDYQSSDTIPWSPSDPYTEESFEAEATDVPPATYEQSASDPNNSNYF